MKTTVKYPATLLCDFYKVSHREQYPNNTEKVYATWTPRASRIKGVNEVVCFGIQAFIKEWLIDYFNEMFFNRPKEDVIAEYERVITYALGKNTDPTHIAELHDLGYLPIKISALKEGALVPIRVPMMTIENTDCRFFWLTNYLETIMSAELWMPMTSATIALQYRKTLEKYAELTGGDKTVIPFQGHDFSMRGMAGFNASYLSGMGHLLSFVGTDTIPSIMAMENYYNANIEDEIIGSSISATEHSVQCAGGKDEEFNTYKRLINEVYPSGFVSIVSDTWDFWNVVTNYLPRLKEDIMKRDGRVVIRPDSGNPVDILCGTKYKDARTPEEKGLIQCLWEIFGGTITEKGYKQLDNHIGAIYGDAITMDRCKEICERLYQKGFASTNIIYGVGSFSYQYNTRDTFGFALKTTYAIIDGKERMLFKDPITDDGTKRSQRGLVVVNKVNDKYTFTDGLLKQNIQSLQNELEVVFENGKLLRDQSLSEIRNLISKSI